MTHATQFVFLALLAAGAVWTSVDLSRSVATARKAQAERDSRIARGGPYAGAAGETRRKFRGGRYL